MKHVMTTLALAAGLLASPMLRAQDADMDDNGKKSPEERAKHRTEQMTKELGLNDVQIAKVNTMNMNFFRAMADVKLVKDEAARKNRAKLLKEKRDVEIREILTPEQIATMEKLREQKKDKDGKDKLKGREKPHNE
jgi:Spy/CpxP family protein refolding chaperone